jgi:hypothetical protein
MAERLNAHELMQAELEVSRVCTRCGEQRREHYPGVLLGCRQGRTLFQPARTIVFTIGPIGPTLTRQ